MAESIGPGDPDIHLAHDAAGLGAILLPDVVLAIWRRRPPSAITAWLTALDPAAIDDIELSCPTAELDAQLAGCLRAAGYPADTGGMWLHADIARLGRRYAALLDQATIVMKLQVIETDACRKFHADMLGVRAICTYRGPGTQWLRPADAARLRSGTAPDDAAIQQLGIGDVALMKGRAWAPDTPLVHRSPPIVGSGISRLTLTLDARPLTAPD